MAVAISNRSTNRLMDITKRAAQQIRTVERLLDAYQRAARVPLTRFLTGFYKQNRQMGSRDRRMASRLAYHYFRLGRAARKSAVPVRLAMAEFLCSEESAIAQMLLPDLYPAIRAPLEEKIALLESHTPFRLEDVLPFQARLSAGIDRQAFTKSLFVQPDLFIRLRPPYADQVIAALEGAGITHRRLDEFAVALPNSTALDRIEGIAGKYEIQDYSSQRTGTFFEASPGESWWDACAGAGGKSLLLLDNNPGINLLVSDIRNSILRNLDERFETAGIRAYRRKIIDLTKGTAAILGSEQFDGIILDVPCSGAGTWGRTPEMISAVDERDIERFASLQRQLAAVAVQHLKPGKPMIYITCSVFAEENEQVVAHLQQLRHLRVARMEAIQGYRHRADSLFAARLVAV